MYKVFSGEKCILIGNEQVHIKKENSRVIEFKSPESLDKEYRQFTHSPQLNNLVVTGDKEKIWRVFCTFFVFIEAAGGLVENARGDLLMIYRNGYWDLPKGKMEKNESPDECALREVEEECGVKKLEIVKQLPLTHHIFPKNDKECLKRTYWFRMLCRDTEKPEPQASEGIEKAEWMSKTKVKETLHLMYPSLRDIASISFS